MNCYERFGFGEYTSSKGSMWVKFTAFSFHSFWLFVEFQFAYVLFMFFYKSVFVFCAPSCSRLRGSIRFFFVCLFAWFLLSWAYKICFSLKGSITESINYKKKSITEIINKKNIFLCNRMLRGRKNYLHPLIFCQNPILFISWWSFKRKFRVFSWSRFELGTLVPVCSLFSYSLDCCLGHSPWKREKYKSFLLSISLHMS